MKVLVLLFLLITGKNVGQLDPTVVPTTTAPLYTQVKPDEIREFAAPRSTTTAPHARTMVRTPRTEETTTRTTITSPSSSTTTVTTQTTTALRTQNTTATTDNVTITYTTDLSSTSLLNTISNVISTTGIVKVVF